MEPPTVGVDRSAKSYESGTRRFLCLHREAAAEGRAADLKANPVGVSYFFG